MSLAIEKRPPSLRGIERFHRPAKVIYRGRIVSPTAKGNVYFADGGVAVEENGKILACGRLAEVKKIAGLDFEIIDLTEHEELPVILPAFSDIHLHWVQHPVRGRFQDDLLTWLEKHIWPHEALYKDPAFARNKAKEFFPDLAKSGTVIAAIYSSVHKKALEAAFMEAVGYCVIGNVLMIRDSPDYLLQNPLQAQALTFLMAFLYKQDYAVTPRFALTCDPGTMKMVAFFARLFGTWIQTHLNESEKEVALMGERYPTQTYTEVYAQPGLLGSRTIMGHCIHMGTDDSQLRLLADSGTIIAHCPSSNEALKSGVMPLDRVRQFGIRWALASDIGAGPSLSMLHVMQQFLAVHERERVSVTAIEALYRATLAGAEVLQLDDRAGSLVAGKDANLVLLKSPGTSLPSDPEQLLREILAANMSDLENLVQQTLLQGRTIYQTA